MKKQVEEAGSRNLVRLMLSTSWTSFIVSIWLFYLDVFFGWLAIFWLFITIVLTGVLSSEKKE